MVCMTSKIIVMIVAVCCFFYDLLIPLFNKYKHETNPFYFKRYPALNVC